MKKILKKVESLYYYKGGVKMADANPIMSGDCSMLEGNCSGLSGNLDNAGITDEERVMVINISDLIEESIEGCGCP